jgi:transposase-like protein
MEMDRNRLACLNPDCPEHGKVGAGNIGIHSYADKRYYCTTCKKRFSARQGTIFYGLKTEEQKVLLALHMLAERMSARGVGRVLDIDEHTVLNWLKRAGQHADGVSRHHLRQLKTSQVQLDEIWSFVEKKDQSRNQPDPAPDKGDVYIWRSIDPITRLRMANHLSKTRKIKDAKSFLRKVADRLATRDILITTDKLKAYPKAILDTFGIPEPRSTKLKGRPMNRERKVFPPGFLYGQIDKERKGGRLVCIDRKPIVGTLSQIQTALKLVGTCNVINISFVERDNLSFRQHNGRTVRKTLSYSKNWQMHQCSVDFEDAMHNFVRSHSSLRTLTLEPDGRHKW